MWSDNLVLNTFLWTLLVTIAIPTVTVLILVTIRLLKRWPFAFFGLLLMLSGSSVAWAFWGTIGLLIALGLGVVALTIWMASRSRGTTQTAGGQAGTTQTGSVGQKIASRLMFVIGLAALGGMVWLLIELELDYSELLEMGSDILTLFHQGNLYALAFIYGAVAFAILQVSGIVLEQLGAETEEKRQGKFLANLIFYIFLVPSLFFMGLFLWTLIRIMVQLVSG